METQTYTKIKALIFILIGSSNVHLVSAVTCPGFPGYCSESFPGQTCVVVCSKGRNNVPLCQEDGSWTDIPRCIEHEPGVEIQIPGLCPGIAGYCSEGFMNDRCRFNCPVGKDIDSTCTPDGTWEPYPTCAGDLREIQDGCNPCPGPDGGPRNRTEEAILGTGPQPKQRKPKDQQTQGRVVRPTFAGNQVFGQIPAKPQQQQPTTRRPPTPPQPRPTPATPTPRPVAPSPSRPQFTQQQPSFFGSQSGQRSPFGQPQRPQISQQRPFSQQRPQFPFSSFPRQQSRPSAASQPSSRPSASSAPRFFIGSDGRLRPSTTSSAAQTPSSRQPTPQTISQPPPRPVAASQPAPQQAPRRPQPTQSQQPRRIANQPSFQPAPARTPVPPPPQPVRSGPQEPVAVAIFQEDDPAVPAIGGGAADGFFGPFQVFDPASQGGPPAGAVPDLPSFPAIPVSDRSGGLPNGPPGNEFGPFQVVPL